MVIDTLQRVRRTTGKAINAYQADYKDVGILQKFASEREICIVLVHHLRKMKDETDPFAQISGTNGIFGAADSAFVMTRRGPRPRAGPQRIRKQRPGADHPQAGRAQPRPMERHRQGDTGGRQAADQAVYCGDAAGVELPTKRNPFAIDGDGQYQLSEGKTRHSRS